MDGDCRTLTLTGAINSIVASFSQEEQRVNAIHYFKGKNKVAYGTLLENGYTVWNFTDDKPLIGLYGR